MTKRILVAKARRLLIRRLQAFDETTGIFYVFESSGSMARWGGEWGEGSGMPFDMLCTGGKWGRAPFLNREIQNGPVCSPSCSFPRTKAQVNPTRYLGASNVIRRAVTGNIFLSSYGCL